MPELTPEGYRALADLMESGQIPTLFQSVQRQGPNKMTRRADIAARLPIVGALPLYEAAAYVGVSLGTFQDAQNRGLMPHGRKLGNRVVYRVADLDAALAALDFVDSPYPQDIIAPGAEIIL